MFRLRLLRQTKSTHRYRLCGKEDRSIAVVFGNMSEKELLALQKAYFASGKTLEVEQRILCLRRLKWAIQAHEQEAFDALQADFSKCPFDTYTTEILLVLNEIDDFVKHLKRWSKPKRVHAGIFNFPSRGRICYQPFGTVLVIAPWNYPFMLALLPLVGAVAAGNCVTLKPSSQTPHTSEVLRKIVNEAFPAEQVQAVLGDHRVSDALLDLPYDFIFFTGSPTVGKKVMAKAAEHLTPVILELGGKSPCIVDKTANLRQAAKRIVWGKFVNAGQTCVAPDYLLVEQSIKDELLEYIKQYIGAFYYTAEGKLSQDFPQIISLKHYHRLTSMIADGRVICGGKSDAEMRKIEPTVLDNLPSDSAAMQEEIFGPVLPVLEFSDLEEAIDHVNAMPKPLALYFFSTDKKAIKTVLRRTSSGGGCINDTVMHVSSEKLPFGGVGNSGMGVYHGRYSFEAFSNIRSILHKSSKWEINLKYPPHAADKISTVKKFLR